MTRPTANPITVGADVITTINARDTTVLDYIDSKIVPVQTQAIYDALKAAGNDDKTALYVVPEDSVYLGRDLAARTVVDGLGTPDKGTWSILQGPAANFDLDSTGLIHVGHPGTTSDKSAIMTNVDTRDQEVGFSFKGNALISAGNMQMHALLRTTDTSNTYRLRALIQNGVNIQLTGQVITTALGNSSDLGSTITTGLAFAANTRYRLRAQVFGGFNPVTVRGKIWAEGTVEPASWVSFSDTNAFLTSSTDGGFYTRASAATPTTYLMDIGDFYVAPLLP